MASCQPLKKKCSPDPQDSGMGTISRSGGFSLKAVLRVRIRIGSGSRRAKITHKNRKKWRYFIFWNVGCSILRAEGFSCSTDVLYGGLGISKLQKKINFYSFSVFGLQNPWSGSGFRITCNAGSWSGFNESGSTPFPESPSWRSPR